MKVGLRPTTCSIVVAHWRAAVGIAALRCIKYSGIVVVVQYFQNQISGFLSRAGVCVNAFKNKKKLL